MVYLKKGNIAELLNLDEYEISSVVIACLIHDFKHPGYTNMFLVNTSDPIAIKYNGNFFSLYCTIINFYFTVKKPDIFLIY
jgi:hypothetical protein